jgi:voltage-gated potassium channel
MQPNFLVGPLVAAHLPGGALLPLRPHPRPAPDRAARSGRIVGRATSHSAGATLSTRLGWLGAVTVIVILATSQILYEFADFDSYGQALHVAAFGAITGEPISADGAVARIAEVGLALYSVVVFATLAGMIGAYFLDRRHSDRK